MRTLIMTVGTGRDRKDIAEALLFSIQQHKPDKVVFFCSEKTASQTMPLLEDSLRTQNIPYEIKTLPNENNVQHLYGQYLEHLKPCGNPQEYVVDFTSGTKAMTAALFAVAVAIEAGQVSYITGPRDETGRVIKSTGVEAFHPAQVYAERQIERAKLLFNSLDFVAAKELTAEYMDNANLDKELQDYAKDLYDLSDAFDKWERFCWQQAASILGKAAKAKSGLRQAVDVKKLKDSSKFCDIVQHGEWSLERLYDLAANARRRFEQGRYDDALSRLYRAYEYVVQVRLKAKYAIKTSEFTQKQLESFSLPEDFKKRFTFSARKSNQTPTAKLGLRDAMELLCRIRDEWGQKLAPLYFGPDGFARQNGLLGLALEKRNRSWLAHGTCPAEKQDVKFILDSLNNLIEEILTPEQAEQFFLVSQFPKLSVTSNQKKKTKLTLSE